MKRDGSTLNETLKLFREGLTPDEIARKRNLAVTTVYTHLERFVKSGEIDLSRLIDQPTLDTIMGAIGEVGTWTLSAIKNHCPDSITYTEIRLVVAYEDFKNGKKTNKPLSSSSIIRKGEVEPPKKISDSAREFYHSIYIRHYKTLSPTIKDILSKNFSNDLDLLPWVKSRSKNFHAFTGGDRFMERELSTFITTLRTELTKNGYDFDLKRKNSSITPEKPKITEQLSAEEIHQKVKQLKPDDTESIEKKLKEPEYPLYKSDFLKEQYHQLICAYPARIRKILIEHIPTVEDFYRKALKKGVEFSSRLADKTTLDTFLVIFREIYENYTTQQLYALNLYQSRLQQKPCNDLSEEEFKKLDQAENPYKYLKRDTPGSFWEVNAEEVFKPRFRKIDSGDLWFCHTIDEPEIDYYDPFTAYADFMVLAITLIQSAKPILKDLLKLKFELGLFEIAAITSFSRESIRLSVGDEGGFREISLFREDDRIYGIGDNLRKTRINKRPNFFEMLIVEERKFRKWLMLLKNVLSEISHDRLDVYSDYYTIKVYDKSNSKSCSIYTLINWIEKNGIWRVASGFKVSDSPITNAPKNFPGKYHF